METILSKRGFDITDMMKAGLHFGHQKSKYHPGMAPFIFMIRNNIHIINLEKTGEKLRNVLGFIQTCAREGKTILFIGTKPPVREVVMETAQACGMPFVIHRWLGGTFSNNTIISKRIGDLKELERKKASGELEKYTKKEQLIIGEEIKRLGVRFQGIRDMTRLPDVVFITDIGHDKIALREARQAGIPIVAIVDTNVNPSLADYPIPANDDAISSVRFILHLVRDTFMEAKTSLPLSSPEVLQREVGACADDAPENQLETAGGNENTPE